MVTLDHTDDDDNTALEPGSPPSRNAGETLAHEALALALTRKSRALLARGSSVLIVRVPDIDWVDMIAEALPKIAPKAITRAAIERSRANKVDQPVGADALRHLQRARSVVFVSQDPDAILDETVMASADASVIIPALSPALLRQVIRRVSQQIARGVTDEMARLPLPVMLGAIRPGLTARQCVSNLARALTKRNAPQPASSVPLLTELPLTASLRRWTDQALADLAAVGAGTLHADQLRFGVLEGLPGTGKSLIAESLARTAGWTFLPASVGGWFTEGDGALGGVARNLKEFTDSVLAAEPCIGFLDEIESLPDRAKMDSRERTWWTPVVTLFLVEIDRLRKSGKQVLLMGGTNYFDRLDAALVRPGRLHQRVTVLPPQTAGELLAVMRYYLSEDIPQGDLDRLARLGLGATPATIEGWIKTARATARADQRPLLTSDILAEIVPHDTRRPADIRAVAVHEVGHALVAHRLGHTIETVSIIPDENSAGRAISAMNTLVPNLNHLRDLATVMLGGRAADIVLGDGPNVGAENDLEAATRVLLAAHERQGMGDTLLFVPAISARPGTATVNAVAADLQNLLERAMEILNAERDLAFTLVDRLISARVLSGAEVAGILGTRPRQTSGVTRAAPVTAASRGSTP